ncbi:MAG: FecR domain-containing protein [Rhizobacter sp.]|nr:FecR domain-containing protein [Rhizobacter sp.]
MTPEIAAEAAAWVARLHGPSRSRAMELECLKWQARSAAHGHAFERCTATWEEVPYAARVFGFSGSLDGLRRGVVDEDDEDDEGGSGPKGGGGLGRGLFMLLGLGAVALVGAVGWGLLGDVADYRTAVGEAQTVVLDDGTRMSLNTDTRVQVDYGAQRRTVNVVGGEAVFEVARDVGRPFVVRAAGSEVVALGTVFSVRLRPKGPGAAASLAVTLVEGKVELRAAEGAPSDAVAPERPVVMQPGERVLLSGAVAEAGAGAAAPVQRLDHPRLEQVLAWQRNEAVFERATLAEAVAEMNRYSRTPVVLAGDLAKADGQVSGQFRTGDNLAFARAMAMLHGLSLQEKEGRLELSRGEMPGR